MAPCRAMPCCAVRLFRSASFSQLLAPTGQLPSIIPILLSLCLPVRSFLVTSAHESNACGMWVTGTLPASWGGPQAFPQLQVMLVDINHLTGTLPSEWGSQGGFRQLSSLYLGRNNFHGSLPSSWAGEGAFPSLQLLSLEETAISGTIPQVWAMPHAFPSLLVANLSQNPLAGSLPAFDNAKLNVIDAWGCNFGCGLDTLWNSSAPLTAIEASNNNLIGSLPDTPESLGQLAYLGLRDNQLEGTVPLSWLQAGDVLSHVSFLDLGKVWDRSTAMVDWRQQLCLQQDLYDTDVTGRQEALLPGLKEEMATMQETGTYSTRNLTLYALWTQTGGSVSQFSLAYRFLHEESQMTSVRDICRNTGSTTVLLIVWLTFGGCSLLIVGTYLVMCKLATRGGSDYFGVKSCLSPVWALGIVLMKGCAGFGGLAFYYWDLITGLIVLCQVWDTWPGHLLAIIFIFHFTAVGAVLAFHALRRLTSERLQGYSPAQQVLLDIVPVVISPLLVPVVILLDTVALVREVVLFIKHGVKLPGLQWLRPGYVAAFQLHRCVHAINFLGLSWLDLESYEDMHNLVAAVFQSLPTVILNSVIFSLGNKPSNGIFLSNGLFVTSVIASCLAMLKCLIIVFWQAYRQHVSVARHVGSLLIGKTLAGIRHDRTLQPQTSNVELLARKYEVSGSAPLGV